MTHGIFWHFTGDTRAHITSQLVAGCIHIYTVLGVTKTSCVTVAPAVGGISDYTLCILGVQPEMIQGIFWHFTGDTQLLIVRIHTHHRVGSYQTNLCNRCTCGGWPI
jgi:hypothetical protein